MKDLMPLSLDQFSIINSEEMDTVDAIRVRFCDLLDSHGNKVFRSLLMLEEEIVGSGLDILNIMEKREII